ncbi:Aldehyde reductase II [Fusarium keratoplasticum]|uniref:Aldehyde reductase II n=1 Tax=Fusarium keratoplasticum TaxID=1328300 RepID=A0ACC0QF23_9HYPO|nr:Aldehyde reductase II [Fusarium keratoplasticum]KAI8649267.1 Aldehyde reductase II [Fusarium keratoplasticum]
MSPTLENLKPSQIAIPAGELIAVSGANGFMGSHICDQLLHLGYRVRGIVRNKERGAWLVNYFEEKYGPEVFELAQVPDMTVPRSCDDAVSDTFNDQVMALAYSKNLPGGVVGGHTVYAAGKTKAEQELWRWYGETSPEFALNVVIPSPCFGQSLCPAQQGYSAANRVLKMLWDGDDSDDVANAFTAQWFCEVKNVSTLHVGALLLSDVKSERLFAYAARFTINDILSIFRNTSPGKKFRNDVADTKPDRTEVPNKRSGEVLRLISVPRWATLKECLEGLVKQWSGMSD